MHSIVVSGALWRCQSLQTTFELCAVFSGVPRSVECSRVKTSSIYLSLRYIFDWRLSAGRAWTRHRHDTGRGPTSPTGRRLCACTREGIAADQEGLATAAAGIQRWVHSLNRPPAGILALLPAQAVNISAIQGHSLHIPLIQSPIGICDEHLPDGRLVDWPVLICWIQIGTLMYRVSASCWV